MFLFSVHPATDRHSCQFYTLPCLECRVTHALRKSTSFLSAWLIRHRRQRCLQLVLWAFRDADNDTQFSKTLPLLRELVSLGGDINSAPRSWGFESRPPLLNAMELGMLAAAQVLLELGADENVKDPRSGASGLHLAKSAQAVQLMVQHGADVEARNHEGLTPLMAQCKQASSDEELLRALITAGGQVNAVDLQTRTSLHIACVYDNVAAARVLLDAGADAKAADFRTYTPLVLAAISDARACTELMKNFQLA